MGNGIASDRPQRLEFRQILASEQARGLCAVHRQGPVDQPAWLPIFSRSSAARKVSTVIFVWRSSLGTIELSR